MLAFQLQIIYSNSTVSFTGSLLPVYTELHLLESGWGTNTTQHRSFIAQELITEFERATFPQTPKAALHFKM